MGIAAEWIEKLQTEEGSVIFRDMELSEKFIVDNIKIKASRIHFINIRFRNDVIFQIQGFDGTLRFSNCELESLEFKSCNSDGKAQLAIVDSNIHIILLIENCNLPNTRVALYRSKINQITFEDISLENNKIDLFEIESNYIEFENTNTKTISLNNLNKRDRALDIYFTNTHAEDIDITNSSISKLYMKELWVATLVGFKKNTIEHFYFETPARPCNLDFQKTNFTDAFEIVLYDIQNMLSPKKYELNVIKFDNCDLGKNARITGYEEVGTIEGIIIEGTAVTESILTISDLLVNSLRLAYDRSVKDLRLSNLKVSTLSMVGLRNSGELNFSNIVPYGENLILYIASSQPGNWKLINCNFKTLKRVVIEGSDLLGLRYASVEWFNREALQYDGGLSAPIVTYTRWQRFKRNYFEHIPREDREAAAARNRREVYRMLKEAAENQKDRFRALRFQQEEMLAQGQYLRLTQRFYSPERFVFWAGSSNNHGLSWWKPVVLAGICSIPFFIAIVIGGDPAISHNDLGTWATWKQIFSHSEVFPQLLNPVHSMDKMFPGVEVHWGTWWLDYMHRLLMAFFIVQTVSAFRKYMKA